ncbi:MAG: hypothetical protein KGQ59_06080 [Bdellovibrionales bacterium]|nr:hypothetical protein [Bdellovibrionales bacterium]
MKLRKETRENHPALHHLYVEGAVSPSDFQILSAGIKKLSQTQESWVIDFSQASFATNTLLNQTRDLCLDAAARSAHDLWFIAPTNWAHVQSAPELHEILSRQPRADSIMEAWYKERAEELQIEKNSLNQQFIQSADSKTLALRCENSRLKRRLKTLQSELEKLSSLKKPHGKEMLRMSHRILSTMEHAIQSSRVRS